MQEGPLKTCACSRLRKALEVESLIEHQATMTPASVPHVERKKVWGDSLIWISVGIENDGDNAKHVAG